MTDTPKHVRDIQRKIWLQKSPGERLLQALQDNEALFLGLKAAKEKLREEKTMKR